MNSSKGLKKILFTLVETFCFIRLNKIYVLNKQDYLLLGRIGVKKGVQYKSKGIGCDILRFDTKNFTPIMNDDTKSNLNISDQFVICFTGRFVDFKGFHFVIKAFFKLIEKYPDKFKLILLGGRDSIHSCGLSSSEEERMISHKDIIAVGYTSDVAKYLAISDVFLFPSKKEGLPTCVLESISMGVPVITMNSRGNNDIITDGYNGFLIEPTLNIDDTIKEIIHAIEKIYMDNDLKIELSNNALKDRKEVSRQKFIEEHKLLYSQISL
jgi:glycosyltransferase involved in cell wall biosynthesis